MRKLWDKLNPEHNIITRAYFYSVGFWGSLHMFSSVVQAIHRHRAGGLNPLRIDNISQPAGHFIDSPVIFFGGWAVFWAGYYLILKLLKSRR